MAVGMDAAGRYLDWGVIQISLTNLLIILAMAVLFVAAVLVPFPGGRHGEDDPGTGAPDPAARTTDHPTDRGAGHTAGHAS